MEVIDFQPPLHNMQFYYMNDINDISDISDVNDISDINNMNDISVVYFTACFELKVRCG